MTTTGIHRLKPHDGLTWLSEVTLWAMSGATFHIAKVNFCCKIVGAPVKTGGR